MVKTRLQLLSEWRQAVNKLVEILRRLYPSAQVYLFGGAAENRLTVLSDIDIVVVSKNAPCDERKKLYLRLDIRDRAVTLYGLPWDYPVDIHLYSEEEFEKAKKHYRRMIEIKS